MRGQNLLSRQTPRGNQNKIAPSTTNGQKNVYSVSPGCDPKALGIYCEGFHEWQKTAMKKGILPRCATARTSNILRSQHPRKVDEREIYLLCRHFCSD